MVLQASDRRVARMLLTGGGRVVHALGRPAGWVEYDNCTIFFDDYTTYNCKEPCKGYKKLAFFDQYFALFRKRYKIRPQLQWKTVNCRQFCCQLYKLVSGWVGLGWITQLTGWVGLGRVTENGPTDNSGGGISGSWLRLVPTCIPSPFLPLPEFVSHLLLEMAYYGEFCGTEIKHDTLQFIAFPAIFFRSDVGAIHLCPPPLAAPLDCQTVYG